MTGRRKGVWASRYARRSAGSAVAGEVRLRRSPCRRVADPLDSPPMGDTTRAAFFDCDKTLIPGSSLYLLARGMYERDYVRLRNLFGWAFTQLKYTLSGKEQMGKIDDIQAGAYEFVRGRHSDELRQLGQEITEERILPRVYEDIARVIAWHTEHGLSLIHI